MLRCLLAAAAAAQSTAARSDHFLLFSATCLHQQRCAVVVQRIIALLSPRAIYSWNSIACATSPPLAACADRQIVAAARCFPASPFALHLYHFSTHAPRWRCAACSLALSIFTATLSLFPVAVAARRRGDRRCRTARANFLLLPFSLLSQCFFAPDSCMCSLSTVSALLCCAPLLLHCLPRCAVCAPTCSFRPPTVSSAGYSPSFGRALQQIATRVGEAQLLVPPMGCGASQGNDLVVDEIGVRKAPKAVSTLAQ